jgi:FkbM family methyltransferase
MHSLRKEWAPECSNSFEEVDTITLDELAEHLPTTSHPPLVKLDVEGAEVDAMRGG